MRIMIVDDSRIARKVLHKMMPPEYADSVTQAESGTQAIELYAVERPDLIFLDLTMPDMHGFEVLAKLRELDPEVRVVVLTADVQTEARERVLALGAIAVLAKPPKPEDVASAIHDAAVS